MRWTVLAIGATVLGLGVFGASRDWPTPPLVLVLAAGFACLVLGLVADRITGIIIGRDGKGATKIQVALAQKTAEVLSTTGLDGIAATYAFVHNQLADDPSSKHVKIALQDELVALVRANAFVSPLDREELDRVLTSGSPAVRALAYGVLQGDTSLADRDLLTRGISDSKSGNEQYQALVATESAWPGLSGEDRSALVEAIETAPYLRDDPDRVGVAERILGRPLRSE